MISKDLVSLIRAGLATERDLASAPLADVLAVKTDPDHVQRRFSSAVQRANGSPFGVDVDRRRVVGVPHSTERVDRHGDIIRVRGWKLDAYRDNPQLLFGHDSHSMPIGTGRKTRRGKSSTGLDALLIDEEYHTEELNPEAEAVWRMVAAGKLPGRSVGFRPLKSRRPESEEELESLGLGPWGVLYEESELVESSVVTIPANPDALQGKGSLADECRRVVSEWLEGELRAGKIERADAERLICAVAGDGARVFVPMPEHELVDIEDEPAGDAPDQTQECASDETQDDGPTYTFNGLTAAGNDGASYTVRVHAVGAEELAQLSRDIATLNRELVAERAANRTLSESVGALSRMLADARERVSTLEEQLDARGGHGPERRDPSPEGPDPDDDADTPSLFEEICGRLETRARKALRPLAADDRNGSAGDELAPDPVEREAARLRAVFARNRKEPECPAR